MEVLKIEPTDETEEAVYVAKVPYEVKDDFGNTATLYRKERLNKESLELQKEELEKHLAEVNEKLKAFK